MLIRRAAPLPDFVYLINQQWKVYSVKSGSDIILSSHFPFSQRESIILATSLSASGTNEPKD